MGDTRHSKTASLDLREKIQSPCSTAELVGNVRRVADVYIHKRVQAANFKGKKKTLVLILEVVC